MPNPFTNTGKIEDRRYFFGRKEELDEIFDRLNGVQPGSVNLVGERLIGRSSLLWHIQTVAPKRLPQQFCVVYLDLLNGSISSADAFREAVLRSLNYTTNTPVTANDFDRALSDIRARGQVVVLLLDNFEYLTRSPDQFSAQFYSNLRALISSHFLVCIVVTPKPLKDYEATHKELSTLHIVCPVVMLKDLKADEATAMLSQPTEYTFGKTHMDLAQRWAGNHPKWLTLAANCIFRQLARHKGMWSTEQATEAERRYRKERKYIESGKPRLFGLLHTAASVWSVWHRCANWFEAHPKTATVLGIVALAVFALIVGRLTFPQLFEALLEQAKLLPTTTPLPTLTPTP